MIEMIYAKNKRNVIGNKGDLPWHVPEDLKWFKYHTLNKTVVMGRKTYQSIGKPLPNRKNVIISSTLEPEDCSGSELVKELIYDENLMVVGGLSLYNAYLPHVERIYETIVNNTIHGDTPAPTIDYGAFTVELELSSGEGTYRILRRKK